MGGTTLVELDAGVLEEARAATARVEALVAGGPTPGAVDIDEVRRTRSEGGAGFPPPERIAHAVDEHVPGPGGPLRVRILVPPAVRGVYLYIHGGGWWNGGADQHDTALWDLAQAAEVAVVSTDYRLAPEHPWPAAVEDCEAVGEWLLAEAPRRFGTTSVVAGGESCGAHLALLTALRLRRRPHPLRALDLRYGIYDLSLTPSVRCWDGRRLLLDRPTIEWFIDAFTPGMTPEERRRPEVSPLYAPLHDLPPALLSVGTLDPLLDDSLFLAARWRASGGDATLHIYPESIHGFPLLGTRLAAEANRTQARFVKEAIGG